jgi:uncharacterized protein (TIGR03437 family)
MSGEGEQERPRREDIPRSRFGYWALYAAVTGSTMAMAHPPAAGVQGDPLIRAVHSATSGRAFSRKASRPLFMASAAITGQAQQAAPVIAAGGVVPLNGKINAIQAGEWVSIFGSNLASGTAVWKGDFPTMLGGTSVQINGKAAYLSFVSPTQINLQAPDDPGGGAVSVTVTTAAGTAHSTVSLIPYSPSFPLLDSRHIAAIIVRSDRSGAYANGTYDILGPTGNCFGYRTVAARPGDVVEIFGVGFGPTTPFVPAGKPFSGAAPIMGVFSLTINKIPVKPTFVGMSSPGLYQINVVIPPGIGAGDVSIVATVGGASTQGNLLFSLQGGKPAGACILPIVVGDGGTGDGDGDGGVWGDGDGGVGDGGVGDGGVGDGGVGDGGVGDGGVGDGGGGDGDGGDGDGG